MVEGMRTDQFQVLLREMADGIAVAAARIQPGNLQGAAGDPAQALAMRQASGLKSPEYKAKMGDDFDVHSASLDNYFRMKMIQEDGDKKRWMFNSLDFDARRRVYHLRPQQATQMAQNYDAYVASLKEVFLPASDSHLAKIEFGLATQLDTEPVQSYHSRKHALYKRAYPNDNNEAFFIDGFIQGLASGAVQVETRRWMVRELDQTSIAVLKCASDGTALVRGALRTPDKRSMRGLYPTSYRPEDSSAMLKAGPQDPSFRHNGHNSFNRGQAYPNAPEPMEVDFITRQGVNSLSYQDWGEPPNVQEFWEDTVAQVGPSGGCFLCGGGHYKRECPLRTTSSVQRGGRGGNSRGGGGMMAARGAYVRPFPQTGGPGSGGGARPPWGRRPSQPLSSQRGTWGASRGAPNRRTVNEVSQQPYPEPGVDYPCDDYYPLPQVEEVVAVGDNNPGEQEQEVEADRQDF